MSEDASALLAVWAALKLPARLDTVAAAKLLGFTESDLPILMSAGLLTPLGNPAPNAPKLFATLQLLALAADTDWLHKATKEVARHWRRKRERNRPACGRQDLERLRSPKPDFKAEPPPSPKQFAA